MICYQDEKIYGPSSDGLTKEERRKEIERLEIEIYGHVIDHKNRKKRKPMIYDTKQHKLVERTKEYDEEVKRRFADWNGEDE